MLIFRLKPGVICSPELPLKLSDVAYGLCDAGYEDVMGLSVHAPSRESYIIDALDVTRAVSVAYPDLRIEMRGTLTTRVCPIRATVFQIRDQSSGLAAPPSAPAKVSSQLTAPGGQSSVGDKADPKSYAAKLPRYASPPAGTAFAAPKKEGFLRRLKNMLMNGGLIMEETYQQIPQFTLDTQPRPGDREVRFKGGMPWDKRNKQEVEDNATKEP